MGGKPDLSQCTVAEPSIEPLCHLDVPFGTDHQLVRCLPTDKTLIATFEGRIVIALKRKHGGLFKRLTANDAREWAADLTRAADDLDGGKGKQ